MKATFSITRGESFINALGDLVYTFEVTMRLDGEFADRAVAATLTQASDIGHAFVVKHTA